MLSAVIVREITGVSFTVFKVISGAETVREYNRQCLDRVHNQSDWTALYTQLQAEHIVGTLPYRWESGYREALLIEVAMTDVTVIVVDDKVMHDSSVSQDTKATLIKNMLHINQSMPLMPTLGERGQIAAIRETENEWEIVIPHELFTKLYVTESLRGRFTRRASMPITAKWASAEGSNLEEDCTDDDLPKSLTEIFPGIPSFLSESI